jgi:LPPG:FO 2-phospho-L-lactate transferase
MAWAGEPLDSDGIAAHYAGLLDGLIADRRALHVTTLETEVSLNAPAERRRVAHDVLEFAAALA